MAETDARKRSLKKKWDTFKESNPKTASVLKGGADILTHGAISQYELLKKEIADKKRKKKSKNKPKKTYHI